MNTVPDSQMADTAEHICDITKIDADIACACEGADLHLRYRIASTVVALQHLMAMTANLDVTMATVLDAIQSDKAKNYLKYCAALYRKENAK